MGEFPDPPEQPRSSEYHARRWNQRSGGWASISTGRSHPPLNNVYFRDSSTQCHPTCRTSLFFRHFAEGAAAILVTTFFLFSGFRVETRLHGSLVSVF